MWLVAQKVDRNKKKNPQYYAFETNVLQDISLLRIKMSDFNDPWAEKRLRKILMLQKAYFPRLTSKDTEDLKESELLTEFRDKRLGLQTTKDLSNSS